VLTGYRAPATCREAVVRLSGRAFVIVVAALGLLIVVSTDQIVPATSQYQAQMRLWLAGRATGITAYLLLTGQVVFGLILSHPVNQSTWRLSRRLFPWHENLYVFVLAFLGAHIVSLILDPYAGVGLGGAFIPGLSSYRTSPVALGTLSLYALLVTGLTARYTKLLPPGFWLKLHRFAIVALILAWVHGMLAGTDSGTLQPMYVATGTLVLVAAAYRYWVSRRQRPTFATSLPEGASRPAGTTRSGGIGPAGATVPAGIPPTSAPTVPPTPEATR
jgi:predicted ferric reductase